MFQKQESENPLINGRRVHYPVNHGYNHGSFNLYDDIHLNTLKFWEKFGLLCNCGVNPGSESGYLASGPLNYVGIWMSEFGVPGMDDDYDIMQKMFPTVIDLYRQGCTRYYCGNSINGAAITQFTTYVNDHYDDCTGVGDAVGYFPFFYHGTVYEDSMDNFHAMNQVIMNHANYENAGIYTIQEAYDYERVYRRDEIIGNKLYTYLSYSGIERHLMYFNASFIVANADADIIGVTVESTIEDTSVTFNPTTGLINMYAENPFVFNPNNNPVLPKLLTATADGDTVLLVYDKSVEQTLEGAYEVWNAARTVQNIVTGVSGTGTTWTVQCTDTVIATDKLYCTRCD